MKPVLDGLRGLGRARLAAMAGVALVLVGLLGFLTLHTPDTPMALLYGDLDLRESAQIVEALERAHIPHALAAGGAEITVAADAVPRARLLLARAGLPSGGSIGYEIFDRGDGLTSSAFQQGVSEVRALEGELSRSMRAMSGVKAARVHLVLPRREPFARDKREAQASVLLTMAGARTLDREEVAAILHLVSAAVPGLRPNNVAIVDSRGNLLAKPGESGPAAAAQNAAEMRQATELRLSRAVEEMLERSLGAGHVRAEAAVDLDFSQLHETEEKFDPDGQVVRSSQTTSDNSKSTEAAATVSVQNNLPNADAGAPAGAGSQQQRQEETTNYEIGKTVRTLVREQPQLRRISLAVLVDGVDAAKPGAPSEWKERSPEELERIGRLVRSAIGFDEKRGDKVEVVSMRFAADPGGGAAEPAGLFGLALGSGEVIHLAQIGIVALLALLGILTVLRPMALRLSAEVLPRASLAAGDGVAAASGLLAAPDGAPAADAAGDPAMVSVVNVDGPLRASALRQISEIVERYPDESLSIVRGWMQREPA